MGDEELACMRLGLNQSCMLCMSDCPDYGTEDCALTAGLDGGEAYGHCVSDAWLNDLYDIIRSA